MNELSIPWVEKYRPNNFNDIVLDRLNKIIFNNIVKTGMFPNLLFYGPPGTGKTTTIINLINEYQQKHSVINKALVIHLNASDERGIDIIRNQINNFVSSKPLFTYGIKFVILDEVDYMTKSAQQALKYLLQDNYGKDVRFCLICNYISRIDETLQNEFVRLRFNKLPKDGIIKFLKKICENEKIIYNNSIIDNIQSIFINDMRSMINYLQMNNMDLKDNMQILDTNIWNKYFGDNIEINGDLFEKNFNCIVGNYSMNKICIIKSFMNYIIRHKKYMISKELLDSIENIIHNNECDDNLIYNYFIVKFKLFFN